jgi:hypothetical protein
VETNKTPNNTNNNSKLTKEQSPPQKPAPQTKNGKVFELLCLNIACSLHYKLNNSYISSLELVIIIYFLFIESIFGNDLNLSDGTDSDGSDF